MHGHQEQWEQRKKEFTGEQKRASWDRTADIVKMYSEEMVKRWNGEIDTLLVYVRTLMMKSMFDGR